MKTQPLKPIPIYTTRGDPVAFLVFPFLYNLNGEWIGFVTPVKEIYSVRGDYVGWLGDGPRIFRKRSFDYSKPKLDPPTAPAKIVPPATIPLAPLMSELTYDMVDVLMDDPDLLPTVDMGELREDMD